AAFGLPEPLGNQPVAKGLWADPQLLDLQQLLAGEGRTEVRVTQAISLQHRPLELSIALMVRRLAAQAVDDGSIATSVQLALQAADLAGAQLEQSGCLRLCALTLEHRMHHLEDIALLLTHGYPVWGWHVGRHGSSLA